MAFIWSRKSRAIQQTGSAAIISKLKSSNVASGKHQNPKIKVNIKKNDEQSVIRITDKMTILWFIIPNRRGR